MLILGDVRLLIFLPPTHRDTSCPPLHNKIPNALFTTKPEKHKLTVDTIGLTPRTHGIMADFKTGISIFFIKQKYSRKKTTNWLFRKVH